MSQLERFLNMVRNTAGKGLRTGVPPQYHNPQNIEQLIEELKRGSIVSADDLVLRVLEEHKKILVGDVDDQIKITASVLSDSERSRKNPDLWCHLATMTKKKGDIASAVVFFKVALFLNPNHSDANFNYGNLLRDQGNLVGAEARYRNCIEIDGDDYNAHNNLGEIFIRIGRHAEAEIELKRAINIFSDHTKAHNNLASLYVAQGRFREAVVCLEKAINIDPNYQMAKVNLAKLRGALGL